MNNIIDITIKYVKNELKDEEAGHNWWHIHRVFNLATFIAKKEGGNLLIIQLASLLHDIADYKFYNGDEEIGKRKIKKFLTLHQVDDNIIEHIEKIIENISYKGGSFKQNFDSLEFRIVQDSDRLDAMGAIGIARAFHYGGYKNNEIYDPNVSVNLNLSPIEYLHSKSTTINHFYEKLLLLKNFLNTKTAQKLGEKKHQTMLIFLENFFDEWDMEGKYLVKNFQ